MKKIYPYIKPHIFAMIIGVTIKFAGTIMDLFIPYILWVTFAGYLNLSIFLLNRMV